MTPSLREIAEAATKGPWSYVLNSTGTQHLIKGDGRYLANTDWNSLGSPIYTTKAQAEANACFIATFNPAFVLELLNRLEASETRPEDDTARSRTVLRFVADHITHRDGFDKPYPVFLRSMIEEAPAVKPAPEHRFGSPPEPVVNPSSAWCDAYADWYYQGGR